MERPFREISVCPYPKLLAGTRFAANLLNLSHRATLEERPEYDDSTLQLAKPVPILVWKKVLKRIEFKFSCHTQRRLCRFCCWAGRRRGKICFVDVESLAPRVSRLEMTLPPPSRRSARCCWSASKWPWSWTTSPPAMPCLQLLQQSALDTNIIKHFCRFRCSCKLI